MTNSQINFLPLIPNIKQESDLLNGNFNCMDYNLDFYTCPFCYFCTNFLTISRKHIKAHCDEKNAANLPSFQIHYKCENCNFQTYSCLVASTHEKKHTLNEIIICDKCKFTTRQKTKIKYHQTSEEFQCFQAEIERYSCLFCDFTTNFRLSFSQHLNTHSGKKKNTQMSEILYKCQDCNFHSNSYLVSSKHKLNFAHNPWKYYQCDQCEHFTKQLGNLRNHKRRIHLPESEIKWFICAYCPYKTKDKHVLLRHFNGKHTPKEARKLFYCDQCDYTTMYTANFGRHKRKEHSNSNNKDMKNKVGNIEWFECEHCDYKAPMRTWLKEHMLQKHKAHVEENWLKCDKCDYKSKNPRTLRHHKNVKHTQPVIISQKRHHIKPFKCDHCEYTARLKSTVAYHMNCKHTAEDQIIWFQCDLCDYKCKHPNNIRLHKKSKHATPRK